MENLPTDSKWLELFFDQLYKELSIAYTEARKGGKRGTIDEHRFEVNEIENLINLAKSIISKQYEPMRSTAHIIHDPVTREIFAAPFRDRIVHHWIYNNISGWWEKRFHPNSCSCRKGKGTLYGIQTLQRQIQSITNNYSEEAYIIKLDLSGYFTSISRKKLYDRVIWGLDLQFAGNHNQKYELLKYCLRKIIFDNPCKGVRRKGKMEEWDNLPKNKSLFNQQPGVGIVIGNLTSQLFSNIFLDGLDRYVTFSIGVKNYCRYVDDFCILIKEKDLNKAVNEYIPAIRRYLSRMGLTLHPKKVYIQSTLRGVEFLGAYVNRGWVAPGKRIVKNSRKAFIEVAAGERGIESVPAYMGMMEHYAHKKILTSAFKHAGWDYIN